MIRRLEKIRFVLLFLGLVVLGADLRADSLSCEDKGLWMGMYLYCETGLNQTCSYQNDNPGGQACIQDFDDTCNSFCGIGNVTGDDCYWGDVTDIGNGWYCVYDYWIRCTCTEVPALRK